MKLTRMITLFVALSVFASIAGAAGPARDDKDQDKSPPLDRRYYDLKDSVDDIRYELKDEIRHQSRIIEKQDAQIEEMRLHINDLEHELFQTTQSLRNLELEVWDLKKSSRQPIPPTE